MSDHYGDAPRSLRWGRLISKNREMLCEIPEGGLESFESQLDDHLSGRWIRTEVQAGALRLYLLYLTTCVGVVASPGTHLISCMGGVVCSPKGG